MGCSTTWNHSEGFVLWLYWSLQSFGFVFSHHHHQLSNCLQFGSGLSNWVGQPLTAGIDFPACTFPVTRADASIDKPRDLNEWKPLNELDAKIQQDYDPLFYDDAPVSLQLAGKRLEEEKVLEMVEIVSSVLKGIDNKPGDSVTYASPITADSVQDVSGDERSRIQAWQREGGFAVDAKKSGLA